MAKVICKSCGAENNVHGQSPYYCEFCGSELVIEKDKKDRDASTPLIYLLHEKYSTSDKVLSFLKKRLDKEKVKAEIIDDISIQGVAYYYMPFRKLWGYAYVYWFAEYLDGFKISDDGSRYDKFSVLLPCDATKGPGSLCSMVTSKGLDFLDSCSEISSKTLLMPEDAMMIKGTAECSLTYYDWCDRIEWELKEAKKPNRVRISNMQDSEGIVIYLPLVKVLYTCKGVDYEWAFLCKPSFREYFNYPRPNETDTQEIGTPATNAATKDNIKPVNPIEVSIPDLKKQVADFVKKKRRARVPFLLKLFIAIIIGAVSYYYFESYQSKEKERLEQLRIAEERTQNIKALDDFVSSLIGKTYQHEPYLMADDGAIVKVKLLNDSILEYSEGKEVKNQYYGTSIQWAKPKKANFDRKVSDESTSQFSYEAKPHFIIEWGDYQLLRAVDASYNYKVYVRNKGLNNLGEMTVK